MFSAARQRGSRCPDSKDRAAMMSACASKQRVHRETQAVRQRSCSFSQGPLTWAVLHSRTVGAFTGRTTVHMRMDVQTQHFQCAWPSTTILYGGLCTEVNLHRAHTYITRACAQAWLSLTLQWCARVRWLPGVHNPQQWHGDGKWDRPSS